MTFESFIARRYLLSRRKPFFASFLLFITLLAVASGVFALVFVLSVMNGFESDFQRRVLGFKAPMTVTSENGEDLSADTILIEDLRRSDPHIQKVLPFIEGEAVIQSESGSTAGARIRGISEPPLSSRFERLEETDDFSAESLVLGDQLASTLMIHPEFPERVRLIFPLGDVGPTGDLLPRVRSLHLTGVFHSGFYDYDNKYALIPYRQAVRLFGTNARTGLEVWIDPPDSDEIVQWVKKKLEKNIGGRKVLTWRDENPKLFQAMKMEKIGMFLLLSVLLSIASFNIFGLTSLMVLDKTADMAVLRTVGLETRKVTRIFLLKAAAIGAIGAMMGGGLALLAIFWLRRSPIPLPSSYYLQYLPVSPDPVGTIFVFLFVPVLTTLSALYPSWKSGQVSPVEVLRYE